MYHLIVRIFVKQKTTKTIAFHIICYHAIVFLRCDAKQFTFRAPPGVLNGFFLYQLINHLVSIFGCSEVARTYTTRNTIYLKQLGCHNERNALPAKVRECTLGQSIFQECCFYLEIHWVLLLRNVNLQRWSSSVIHSRWAFLGILRIFRSMYPKI